MSSVAHLLIHALESIIDHASIVLISGIIIGIVYLITCVGRRPAGCPPGPPTIPIYGNLLDLPQKDIHLAYQQWGRKYGPIFSLQLGQQTVIVITSGAVVKNLIDKKSSIYSDRPHLYMQDLWEGSRIIMRSYDEMWKVERKLYHQFLNKNVASKYVPYQTLETLQLCHDMLECPRNFENHMSRTTASLFTSMIYGFRINSFENPVLQELLHNAHGFFTMVHRHRVFDYYPILRSIAKIIPEILNPIARKAKGLYRAERTQFMKLYTEAKQRSSSGASLPCFADDVFTAQKTWDSELLTEQSSSYIAGVAFEAGTDTTKNTLVGFIKAMVLFPEAQKVAQKELDEVVGPNSLPVVADLANLPYIRATAKEALRWFPTGLNGAVPHAAHDQDVYDGHVIPKGASIILAIWSCNNDPELFDNPRTFDPGRQMVDMSIGEDAVSSDYKKRSSWTFGAARRLCPGIHVAETTLLLSIARILWTFNIEHAKDEQGNAIPIDRDAVTQSIAACPMPFKCKIKPRSAGREQVLRGEWLKAKSTLGSDGNYPMIIVTKPEVYQKAPLA